MKSLARHAVLLASLAISSCITNHFVEPVHSIHFSEPWQGSITAAYDRHQKFYFDGLVLLPSQIITGAAFASPNKYLSNDQKSVSFTTGYFIPFELYSLSILAGFGFGSHRMDSVITTNPGNMFVPRSIDGYSDFRKYSLEACFSQPVSKFELLGSAGQIYSSSVLRLSYLDRYNCYEIRRDYWQGPRNFDSIFVYGGPKQNLLLDFGGSLGAVLTPISVVGQTIISLPLGFPQFNLQDYITGSIGVRYNF